MPTDDTAFSIAGRFAGWTSKLPLVEQRQRTEKATKQLVDNATKAYARTLKRELRKIEKPKG